MKTYERSRIYTIGSPLVSRTGQYRALLKLPAVEKILDREKPDVMEAGDPYQVGWKALKVGRALGIPVVGFYHSHFTEAYLRNTAKSSERARHRLMDISRAYFGNSTTIRRDARRIRPLGNVLRDWGVENSGAQSWCQHQKSSAPTDPEPKQYGAELGLVHVKTFFFT